MTIPTLLGSCGHAAGAQNYASGNYYGNVGLGRCPMLDPPFTTESYVSQTIRVPGTISYLSWALEGGFGATLTLALNKRSSSTALAVPFSASTSGWMTDSTDSISVSSGDTLDFVANVGSSVTMSNENFYCISARFDATTGSAQMLTTVGPSAQITPGATRAFVNFVGVLYAGDTTELNKKFYCLAAGTWQNMACNIESSTTTGATTITNRIDTGSGSTNGSMAISVGASTTGYFEDTTHSDAVSVGDLLDYGFLGTSTDTGTLSLQWIGAHFLATNTALCVIGGSQNSPVTIDSPATKYSSLFGGGQVDPVPGNTGGTPRATGLFPYALKASKFTNYLTGASATGAATFALLQNGSPSTLATSSLAGQSGYFMTGSAGVLNFAVGDICANRIVVSGTGPPSPQVTWASAALLLQAT